MKKSLLLIFLFSTGFISSFAQIGKLNVSVYSGIMYSDTDLYSCHVLKGDSVVLIKLLDDGVANFDSVLNGKYQIEIIHNNKVVSSHPAIEVFSNEITSVELTIPLVSYSKNPQKDTSDQRFELALNFLYGPGSVLPISKPSIPLQDVFTIGVNPGSTVMFNKVYGIGGSVGNDISIAHFTRADSSRFPSNADHARYFSWNMSFSLFQRISFFNYQEKLDHGLYLDMGISYHFPLIFHYAATQGTLKLTESRIHQFKDFTAVARFGYAPFMVQVEYRLLDYLIGSLPEMPKLRIGIAFMIRND